MNSLYSRRICHIMLFIVYTVEPPIVQGGVTAVYPVLTPAIGGFDRPLTPNWGHVP